MSANTSSHVVVGVDGSQHALHAVRWAAADAVRRGDSLCLVHAFDDVSLRYARLFPKADEISAMFRTRGNRLLQNAREVAGEVEPSLHPRLEFSPDGPVDALVDVSRDASLVVVGATGLRRMVRTLVGSVPAALAARAHCPVAVVRPQAAEAGPVVLGIDGASAGERAIGVAFEEASWRGALLLAVNVWDDVIISVLFEENRRALEPSAIEEHADALLAQRLVRWRDKYPDVEVRRVLARGRPADELLGMADHAQLMVVGSRGRGRLAGLLLGSTSQALISAARCPVIVARGDEQGGQR